LENQQLLPGRWERLYGAKIGSSLRLGTRVTIKGPTSRSTNGDQFLEKGVRFGMRNVRVAFDVLDAKMRFQSNISRDGAI
jgi:hypothetical protein